MAEYYIGLMSGTSVDGIDAALVEFRNNTPRLINFDFTPFDQTTKDTIKRLSHPGQAILLRDYGALDCHLGHLFASACQRLIEQTALSNQDICAIGSHGQTVYHAPEIALPFSLQIGDPNLIAEITGITTVADFRRRDIAVKGQGAPLVPAFHQAVFSHADENRCIVNIGGIANITVLTQTEPVIGFDTGPGNTLMDLWIHQHLGQQFDSNGTWARTGKVQPHLLTQLKQDPYFSAQPPKSTGKEYFSLTWLEQTITDIQQYKPEDIQASLCQLSAETIADAIKKYCPNNQRTLICGGGIHNQYLLKLIEQELGQSVSSTEAFGVNPDHVEAIAFAWLARQSLNHLPGNLKEVTGAETPVILGGIYPGNR